MYFLVILFANTEERENELNNFFIFFLQLKNSAQVIHTFIEIENPNMENLVSIIL